MPPLPLPTTPTFTSGVEEQATQTDKQGDWFFILGIKYKKKSFNLTFLTKCQLGICFTTAVFSSKKLPPNSKLSITSPSHQNIKYSK